MNTADVQAPAIAEDAAATAETSGSVDETTGAPAADAENTGTAEEPAVPTPVLVARGLGLSEPVVVYPGEIVALAGPPNSGRTAALLSLGGFYAKPSRSHTAASRSHTAASRSHSATSRSHTAASHSATSRGAAPHGAASQDPAWITVSHVIKAQDSGDFPDPNGIMEADPDGTVDPNAITEPAAPRVALGLVRNAYEPEPMLTARDHLAERLRLVRPIFRRTRRELDERAAALPFDPRTLGRDLTPLGRHELMLHVALVSDPDVILIDDIDLGLTPAEQATLIDEIRAAGRAAVVTLREGN